MTASEKDIEEDKPPAPESEPKTTKTPVTIAETLAADVNASSISRGQQLNNHNGASPHSSVPHPETANDHGKPTSSFIVPAAAQSADTQAGEHEENLDSTLVNPAEGVSQWSHQALAPQKADQENQEHEEQWQDMPAYAPYDLYDDDGKLIAREAQELNDNVYEGLGGAGKGYTRVQMDEDARSATSMDDNTSYLFKARGTHLADEDEEQRDPLAQMQATKDLLTEGQRIAYVGVTRLAISKMVRELNLTEGTKATKKELRIASESMKMWSQQMMVRLYAHMEIDSSGGCYMMHTLVSHH